ncbi:MAG: M20/M25/M40 family metallo-hydrolase, partial [Eubacteriales bacterium]|nr:M20/M25/M40 family metallo-hydrolase [Eubacteriales bacterium]
MGMCKNRAWKLLEDMSFVRVAGTPEDLKTAQLLKAVCDEAGVPAEIEEFEVDVVNVKTATLEVLEPEYKAYPVIGIGKTPNTPAEGIVGGFQYIEDAMDANLTDVEGKIVLMQGRAKPDLFEKLKKKGALGYIALGGNMYEDESIKNELRPSNAFGKNNPLPGLRIHISEAEKLVLSKPTKVKIVLESETVKAKAHNVVATIEGTDLKDEVIAFSAHCDSVPYSKGSWDNATGSVTIAELMHYFKEKGTRRTMKFVWCGAEEIGLVGSREYCKKHEAELKDYIFNINFDMTGVTIGYEKCCCSTSEDTMHAIEFFAKLNNYPVNIELGTYASDSTSFAGAGVPACTFARLQAMGGAQIHNHNDTMERLDPDSFMITLNFVSKFAEQIANAPVNPIPRKFAESVTKKLEEGKKMRAAMEAKDEKKEEKPSPSCRKRGTK